MHAECCPGKPHRRAGDRAVRGHSSIIDVAARFRNRVFVLDEHELASDSVRRRQPADRDIGCQRILGQHDGGRHWDVAELSLGPHMVHGRHGGLPSIRVVRRGWAARILDAVPAPAQHVLDLASHCVHAVRDDRRRCGRLVHDIVGRAAIFRRHAIVRKEHDLLIWQHLSGRVGHFLHPVLRLHRLRDTEAQPAAKELVLLSTAILLYPSRGRGTIREQMGIRYVLCSYVRCCIHTGSHCAPFMIACHALLILDRTQLAVHFVRSHFISYHDTQRHAPQWHAME
mmetsp:Transcript_11101/g.30667  ORF Transcript_11101/g.30667 Transcript_11101/m.30667 type:complete len:284 (-) Transcript_11101:830-1681(-)